MAKGRGTYPWGMAANGTCFNVYATTPVPLEEDPILGTTERVTSGFYVKDGQVADFEDGTCETERDEDGFPVALRIEGTDSLGRSVQGEAEFINRLKWSGGLGDYLVNWCQAKWDLDGDPAAIGSSWDYMTYPHYRRFHQARQRAGALKS
jgi:hypothetical protein